MSILGFLEKRISEYSDLLESNNFKILYEKIYDINESIDILSKVLSEDIYQDYCDFFSAFYSLNSNINGMEAMNEKADIFVSSFSLYVECLQALSTDTRIICSEDTQPLVSVILPCYNHEEYVEEAILSVITQTYSNIELLVADDASTDQTASIIRKYEDFFKKVIYSEHNTTAMIMVELTKYSNGKYVAIMHSDDIWENEKIQLQVEYMESHKDCGTCFTWASYVDQNKNIIQNPVFRQPNRTQAEWLKFFWEHGNALCHPSAMTRKEYVNIKSGHGCSCRQLPDFFKWVNHVQRTNIHIIQKDLTYMRRYNSKNKQNTSVVSKETVIRDNMENGMVWPKIIEEMPEKMFVDAFKDLFIYKDANTEREIKCEKFFLMLNHSSFFVQHGAFPYFDSIYLECRDCLEHIYNYTRKNYWDDFKRKGFYPVIDRMLGD